MQRAASHAAERPKLSDPGDGDAWIATALTGALAGATRAPQQYTVEG